MTKFDQIEILLTALHLRIMRGETDLDAAWSSVDRLMMEYEVPCE